MKAWLAEYYDYTHGSRVIGIWEDTLHGRAKAEQAILHSGEHFGIAAHDWHPEPDRTIGDDRERYYWRGPGAQATLTRVELQS